jgi:hypothetical protein
MVGLKSKALERARPAPSPVKGGGKPLPGVAVDDRTEQPRVRAGVPMESFGQFPRNLFVTASRLAAGGVCRKRRINQTRSYVRPSRRCGAANGAYPGPDYSQGHAVQQYRSTLSSSSSPPNGHQTSAFYTVLGCRLIDAAWTLETRSFSISRIQLNRFISRMWMNSQFFVPGVKLATGP